MTQNFESGYHISQLAYPLLRASECGSIVFVSSVSGLISISSLTGSVHGATKGMSTSSSTCITTLLCQTDFLSIESDVIQFQLDQTNCGLFAFEHIDHSNTMTKRIEMENRGHESSCERHGTRVGERPHSDQRCCTMDHLDTISGAGNS